MRWDRDCDIEREYDEEFRVDYTQPMDRDKDGMSLGWLIINISGSLVVWVVGYLIYRVLR